MGPGRGAGSREDALMEYNEPGNRIFNTDTRISAAQPPNRLHRLLTAVVGLA